jgi:hypothetical protein
MNSILAVRKLLVWAIWRLSDMHEKLYEQAKAAIDKLFADTSVDSEDTRLSLKDLRGHIQVLLDALES